MANDAAFGLQISQKMGGSYVGQVVKCYVAAADTTGVDIAPGCAVKQDAAADADGVIGVTRATAGDAIFGVVVGVEPTPSNLENTHHTTGSVGYVYVNIDPDCIYTIQDDASSAIVAADIGLNANLVVNTVNSTTGASRMELASSTKNTTATLQLKIIGFAKGYEEDMDLGDTNQKLLVKINNHQLGSHTGTAGV